jgi:hypothetical protein
MMQMERAMMIAKKRAGTPVLGMSTMQPASVTSFSDDQIIDEARLLGVSLGSSHSDCLKSAKIIKDFEVQRSITMLKCNDHLPQQHDNATLCMTVSRASELCDDLEEEEDFLGDEEIEMPKGIIREKKVRKKSPTIRRMLGGVTVLELNQQNYNDKSSRYDLE